MMFFSFFLAVLGVLAMAMPGFIAAKTKWLSPQSTADMAKFQVNCVYPCLIFSSIYSNYGMERLGECLALPSGSFMIMIVGYAVGLAAARIMAIKSPERRKSFVFQCLINNYSFLPMPLVDMFYGAEGVAALVLSSLGAEIAVWTLGVATLSGEKIRLANLRRLLSPPLVALYLALVCRALSDWAGITGDWVLDSNSTSPLNRLLETIRLFGQATIPLAMAVAGARLAKIDFNGIFKSQVMVLCGLRLALIPLLSYPLILLLPLTSMETSVLLIVSTMPVAIASFLLSEVYGGDREFISATAAATHVLSLITVPLMLWLLGA